MTATRPPTLYKNAPSFRSFALRPLRSPQRPLLVAAAVFVAAAHVPVIAPHLEEAPYMGALFVLLTVGCLAVGLAALIRDSAAVYALAALTCGLAVLGYAATRVIAFPMLADDVGNWAEPLGVISIAGELTVIATAVAALRKSRTKAPLNQKAQAASR